MLKAFSYYVERLFLPPADIRNARKELREGSIDAAEYEKRVNAYMGYAIDVQEKVGLDVLVHGEPERSDMCANFSCAPAQSSCSTQASLESRSRKHASSDEEKSYILSGRLHNIRTLIA